MLQLNAVTIALAYAFTLQPLNVAATSFKNAPKHGPAVAYAITQ